MFKTRINKWFTEFVKAVRVSEDRCWERSYSPQLHLAHYDYNDAHHKSQKSHKNPDHKHRRLHLLRVFRHLHLCVTDSSTDVKHLKYTARIHTEVLINNIILEPFCFTNYARALLRTYQIYLFILTTDEAIIHIYILLNSMQI